MPRLTRRAGRWLTWWAFLMALWIVVDGSVRTDELLAGAGAAALGTAFAAVAGHLAGTELRVRGRWLWRALRLPADVGRDTWIVLAALGRMLLTGTEPRSGFREIPVSFGAATAEGRSRRALLIGSTSLAPNTFALGIDADRDVMVVHELVIRERGGTR